MVTVDAQVEAGNRATARATGLGKFQQSLTFAGHALIADEPAALGGLGAGPSPYDLLSAGLAACTSMTIRLYADRKQLALPGYSVEVAHDRSHATDCANCLFDNAAFIDRFLVRIVFDSPVAADIQAKVLEIAGKCPVHRTLASTSAIVSSLVVPAAGIEPATP